MCGASTAGEQRGGFVRTLTLTFDRALDTTATPAATRFTVAGTDSDTTVNGVAFKSGDARSIELTLSAAVSQGDTGITLSYAAGDDTNPLQGSDGRQVANFSGQPVANTTPDTTPPTASLSSTVNGSTIMEPVQLPKASGGNGRLQYRLTSEPTGLAGLAFDPATRWLTGTPAAVGIFTFTLRATDGDGDTAAVVFLVKVNRAPVARAGDDLTVDPGAPARLDGSRSSDPDGDVLTFAWTQTLGSQVTLSDASYVQPSFEAPWRPEPLVFRLTVTDPDGLSDSDEVTVTVRDRWRRWDRARCRARSTPSGRASRTR